MPFLTVSFVFHIIQDNYTSTPCCNRGDLVMVTDKWYVQQMCVDLETVYLGQQGLALGAWL